MSYEAIDSRAACLPCTASRDGEMGILVVEGSCSCGCSAPTHHFDPAFPEDGWSDGTDPINRLVASAGRGIFVLMWCRPLLWTGLRVKCRKLGECDQVLSE